MSRSKDDIIRRIHSRMQPFEVFRSAPAPLFQGDPDTLINYLLTFAETGDDLVWEYDMHTFKSITDTPVYDFPANLKSPSVVTVRELIRYIHPEDRIRISHDFTDALAGNQDSWSGSCLIKNQQGSYEYVEGRCFIFRDEHGSPERVIGINIKSSSGLEKDTELKQRILELAAIHGTCKKLQRLSNPEILSEAVIQLLESELEYTHCSILLLDEKSAHLVPLAVSDEGKGADFIAKSKQNILSKKLRAGLGITGWVLANGASVISGDVSADPRYIPLRANLCSELCVPLFVNDKPIGVVNIESEKKNLYSEADQRVLEVISSQMAMAIQNARLLQQVESELNERKLSEDALRKNVSFNKKVLESSLSGIYIYDATTHTPLYINEQYRRLTGYALEELQKITTEDYRNLYHSDDIEPVVNFWEDLRQCSDDTVRELEYRILTKSGHYIHCLSQETVFRRNSQGEVDQIIGSFIDLSPKKMAEDNLKKRMRELECLHAISKLLVENGDDKEAVFEGIVNIVPLAFQVPELTCCQLIYHDKSYGKSSGSNLPFTLRQSINVQDKEVGMLEISYKDRTLINTPFLTEELEIVETIGNQVEDYLKQRRAEKLQRITYNIANAISSADNLVELFKFVHNQLHSLMDTRNFYVALYDKEDDLVSIPYYADMEDTIASFRPGKTLTSYVLRSRKSLLATYSEIQELARLGHVEMIGKPSKVWLGVPFFNGENVLGAIIVQSYDDVTAFNSHDVEMLEFVSHQIGLTVERFQSREALSSALAKAQESDKLKSSFLANMSHEIRTPMNSILGFSEMLNDPMTEEADRGFYSEVIRKSSKQLMSIVDDILEISILETSQIKVRRELISVNRLCDDLLKRYESKIEDKPIQFHLVNGLNDGADQFVTDGNRLQQILTYLLNNALKFTDIGHIELGYNVVGNAFVFHVKDTGIGIAEDLHEVIFDRFRQVEATLSRKYGGTGLGLSICKSLVELLGGKIWLESQLGQGTTFFFSIPVI